MAGSTPALGAPMYYLQMTEKKMGRIEVKGVGDDAEVNGEEKRKKKP